MNSDGRPSTSVPAEDTPRPGLGAWLEHLPVPAALVGVVLFLGVGLGLTAIGGWAGIVAVLCLAALVVAFVAAASR